MNIRKIISLSAFVITVNLSAQTNVFQKTTWKIESISADGKAILKKAKKINLPSEQSKFHFLQFDNEKFDTGNSCFHMDGRYNVYEPNVIEFSEGAADMSGDCKEPKSLTGNYIFTLKNDTAELIPTAKIDNDEPMPEVASVEEDQPVEASADVQKSTKKSAKKTKK